MDAPRRSMEGLAAAATAFLLPVAYSPSVYAPFWSPKVAVLLVAGAAGLPSLRRIATGSRRPAAIAAGVYAIVVVLATFLSASPLAATVGLYDWGTGAVFLVGCVGVWALGCAVPARDRDLVLHALVAGIGISALVGVLQTFGAVPVSSLEAPARSFGLAGNPVHLGALAVGIAAAAACNARRSLAWTAVLVGAGIAVQVSGTRFALILLIGVAAAGAVRSGARRGALVVGAVIGGIVLGSLLVTAGGGQSATGRAADDGSSSVVAGGGTKIRLEVWSYARHAILRHPVLGSGPGRFRAATSADRTLAVARFEGGDSVYSDAHDIVVEHLVTTGVLGAAALVLWLLLALLACRGPFRWFGMALLLMSLVQPMSYVTTPLMFLALGAGTSPASDVVRSARDRALRATVVVLAAVAAGALLLGDLRLNSARLDFATDDARQADSILHPWPQPATIRARIASFEALDGRATPAEAIRWRREALRRDPTDPSLAILLAREEQAAGRVASAERDFRRALEHNPWSTQALGGLARLAEQRHDHRSAVRYGRRALAVRPDRRLERLVSGRDAEQPGP